MNEKLAPEFIPVFTEEDIVNLPKYEIYLKLMIDGIASEPFSARGLPPLTEDEKTGNIQKIINSSRERYAEKREVIVDKINRWHENIDSNNKTKVNIKKKLPQKKENIAKKDNKIINNKTIDDKIHKYLSICFRCGKETSTVFKPDGIRPVYCKECLSIIKQEKNQKIKNRQEEKQNELKKIEKEEKEEVELKENKSIRPIM